VPSLVRGVLKGAATRCWNQPGGRSHGLLSAAREADGPAADGRGHAADVRPGAGGKTEGFTPDDEGALYVRVYGPCGLQKRDFAGGVSFIQKPLHRRVCTKSAQDLG